MSQVPDEVMKTAQEMFAAASNLAEFPEDDWQGTGGEWDLNLYVDGDGKNCATLYAVVNGNTDTEVGYPVTPA